MTFGVTYKVKENFFDRKAVTKDIGARASKALGKFGGFVRKTAQRSMRRSKKPSQPGSPPNTHSRDAVASLRNILYAYDRERVSVLIGPVRLNQRQQSWIDFGNVTVPQLHEFGDVIVMKEVSADGGKTWRRRDLRRSFRKSYKGFRSRQRRAVYKPRPFMFPALEKQVGKFPELFTGRAA